MGLLLNDKKVAQFNDNVETAVKTAFTKTYNLLCQDSIKQKKAKQSGPAAPPGSNVFGSKFDPDIQEVASDQDMTESAEESGEDIVESKVGKGKAKAVPKKKEKVPKKSPSTKKKK